jgi:hypothetical protein
MGEKGVSKITDIIGGLPYRLALAGGWIDQPFVSKLNPSAPGSMVVVSVEPEFRWMNRSGICGSTREIALELWAGELPDKAPEELVRELYMAENEGKAEPSGSQDMIGLVYPGVSRLDYDFEYQGGIFPKHIESNNDPAVAKWLGEVLNVVPVEPRPEGYNPLEQKILDSEWIRRLGQSGRDCYDAIINRDIERLSASMNECMECWEAILPGTVRHPTLKVDIMALLKYYQAKYYGAMYSGCGGGYLYVISEESVPGAFKVKFRVNQG